jgi:subtilisin-like proprotein convertase family protein
MKKTSVFFRTVLCSLIAVVFFVASTEARDTSELADLSVSLTSSSSTATNGQWVTFYVTARNNGPTPIYAVDDCEIQCSPAHGQYGDDGAGGGDPSDAVASGPGTINKSNWDIVWFPGAIAPGQSVVMTVSIPLYIRDQESLHTATATGYYSNSDVCDTNSDNDSDSLLLNYEPSHDLSIAIDNQENTSWDLTSGYYELVFSVDNAGPSVASGAVVTSILPEGCTYEVIWPDDPADFSFQGNVLTWNISDHNEEGSTALWPGVTAWMYLQITPTNAGEKVVSSVLTHPYDPNLSNNTADNSMPVTGSGVGGGTVSVQLMGWDEVPTVERYGTIHYVLRLKNNMESNAATSVVITNLIDSRCLFDSASTSQGTVTQNNGIAVFDVGTLDVGADLYLDLYVTPLESGTMTNDARLYMAETGNEYGDSATIEETTVNPGPYVLTVTPMTSVTPTYGFRAFDAVVQTNGQTVAGVTVYAEVTRGPHMGGVSNAVTSSPAPEAPAKAVFVLEDEAGCPGMDYITVTGQVGKISFSLNVQADWQMMGPQTYTCTNLGYILNDNTAVFEINVPDGFVIAAIQTGLHFTHTYPGDLEFRLYSPSDFGEEEIEAYLIEELDAFAFDDLEVGRSNAYCVLDESASVNISSSVAPFSGSFMSQNLEMTNYVGAESMGTWFLNIEDMNPVDFDYGELLGWTLTLEPADGDLDNDGMNDQWEIDNGLDPTDPTDADNDDDGDGISNRGEFRTHTLPQDPSDSFSATLLGVPEDGFMLYWSSTSNQFYTIRWCTNLLEGVVNTLDYGIAATPPENAYVVTNTMLRKAFFKIEQEY